MSGARISVSPIRTASTPTRSSSSICSRLVKPDSETTVLPGGDVREQLVGALDVDAEVREVAVVDADHLGVDVQGDLELVLVVDLDEHVQVERAGVAMEREQRVGLDRGDDQQDRVGAGGRRLVELVRLDDEVLAQHRQVRRRAGGAQVVERAAEVERLGEDAQRRGAAGLVGGHDLLDGDALADRARGRRAALVLRDHADPRLAERLLERARLRTIDDRALEIGERGDLAPAGDLVAGRLHDAFQHAQLGASLAVRPTSRSSASAAAPESIAASAARAPVARSPARPAA